MRERFAAAGYRTFLLRPGRLVPVAASELQPECNVDYLATRGDVDALPGWMVAPPLTMAERLAAVVASCTHTNAHMRAYIARALETADDVVLADARVRRGLGALLDDGTPAVRAAAAWWAARG